MISLTLSRFPFVLVMLGFANVLCMPFIKTLGVMVAACSSVVLTIVVFASAAIYYRWRGLTYRQMLETKLISSMSGIGCLIGIAFLIGGLVIMAVAEDGEVKKTGIEDHETTPMTKHEQMFFGSTFVLMGAGVATMAGVTTNRHSK